jgi:penicillin amidase
MSASSGVAFSRKRVFRNHELQNLHAFLAADRARGLQEFQDAVKQVVDGVNFLYADRVGNLAFWQAGWVPVRAAGFDPRLPLPGDGSAEWSGELRPRPTSINPTRGWLANWNGKPTVDWDNPDHQTIGKQHRLREIEARLADDTSVSADDAKAIALDIARTLEAPPDGRVARFLKPYLLAALESVPPTNPLAGQAKTVLEAWDGSRFADARTSTNLEPGEVIFGTWLTRMLNNTFGDGTDIGAASPNMLIHVLDDALGHGSGVPPRRDYLNGANPNAVISTAFDQALTALGTDPAAWSSRPRGTITFKRPEFPTIPSAGSIPESNRGTYAQIITLGNPTITSDNIITLGQSGFIGLGATGAPVFDPHFNDQLPLYRDFHYKPMHLYRNTQVQE